MLPEPSEQKQEIYQCPNCNARLTASELVTDDETGSSICPYCGAVIDLYGSISLEREYRLFGPQDTARKTRATKPSPVPGVDAFSRIIYEEESGRISMGIELPHERLLRTIKSRLEEIAPTLNLPPAVVQGALNFLARYLKRRTIRKKDLDAFVAAAIYLAGRALGCPRPLDRLVQVIGRPKRMISKAYKLLKETLEIQVRPLRPEDYVLAFGKELGVSARVIRLAEKILELARKDGILSGKDPAGMASAAIYMACKLLGETRSQKQIASVAASTEVTLRTCFRLLKSRLEGKLEELLKSLEEA